MSRVTSRVATIGAATALGVVAAVASLAVLAGSIGGTPPPAQTGPACPDPGSTIASGSGIEAAPLPQPETAQSDDHGAQLALAEPSLTELDGNVPGDCGPFAADTTAGTGATGAPAQGSVGGG